MNSIKLLVGMVLSIFTTILYGQNYEDILRYSQTQYSGTARSMSMGNAFGSLGGDFSALGINPAGIGTYRSSEFSLTPSLILNSTESNLNGNRTDDNKTTFTINQVGFVGTYRPIREVQKGIVSSHFAIGYSRNNNFNYNSMAFARNVTTSMTDFFTSDARGIPPENLERIGNLASLAFNSYLMDYNQDNDIYNAYTKINERFDQTRVFEKEGYAGEINLTAGTNISNTLLLGISVNFTMLRYKETSNYFELFSPDNDYNENVFDRYTVQNSLDVSGNGVNLKIGAIIKPINQLRLGLAYHSPTWYNIEEDYGSRIDAIFFNDIVDSDDNSIGKETFAQNYGDNLNSYDYKMNTPGKFIASASYIFGKKAILSFDYEYMNFSNAKFNSNTRNYNDLTSIREQNDNIKRTFTSTNNFRTGIEYRVTQQISLRGGYSLQASPFKSNNNHSFDTLHGIQNLSDIKNNYQLSSYSAGIGFRDKNYFVDIAYRLSAYDNSYFNYNWPSDVNTDLDSPPQTNVKTQDHYATITIGWKF